MHQALTPRSRHALLAVAFLVFASPTLAEEAGTLTVESGGESATFTLWSEQSDWSGNETWGSVNIFSRPADDASGTVLSLFTLGFSTLNGNADNPEIRAQRPDGTRLFSEDEQGGLSVELAEASIDGDFLRVSGRFSGEMGTSDSFGRDIDLSDPVPVAGTFAVTLGPVE